MRLSNLSSEGPGHSWFAVVAAIVATTLVASMPVSAASLGPTNQQRQVLARTEAHHLVTLATLPAGSTRLATWTPALGPGLRAPAASPSAPDQVDLTHYYLAPGGVKTLSWLEGRWPRGGTLSGTGTGSGPGTPTVRSETFNYPSSPVLSQPQLEYTMLVTFQGQFELRVDAIVLWTPQKSRFSIVPAGATRAVVTVDRGPNVKTNRVTMVTLTRPATINAILSHVNDLPVVLPGISNCPLDLVASMVISFWRTGAAKPYAVVTADPSGCGSVNISEFGPNGALLGVGHDSNGQSLAKFVATSLSIKNWTGMSAL